MAPLNHLLCPFLSQAPQKDPFSHILISIQIRYAAVYPFSGVPSPTAPAQKPTQGDNHFVPGSWGKEDYRGLQRITSQASCQAGWKEKLLISAPADCSHSRNFGK